MRDFSDQYARGARAGRRHRGRRGHELRRVRDELARDPKATASLLIAHLIKHREYANAHGLAFDIKAEASGWMGRYISTDPSDPIRLYVRRMIANVFPYLAEGAHD